MTDAEVQNTVLAALRANEHVRDCSIGVAFGAGVITLTGEVSSLADRAEAARAALSVHGVRAVANEIAVRLPQDHWRTDADIARDAVDAIIRDTEAPDKTITVRVIDGWICLDGETESEAQRTAAEQAVRSVPAMKGVTNLVRVVGRELGVVDGSTGHAPVTSTDTVPLGT